MIKSLTLTLSLFFALTVSSQKLVSGPMLGHVNNDHSKYWLLLKNANTLSVQINGKSLILDSLLTINTYKKYAIVHADIPSRHLVGDSISWIVDDKLVFTSKIDKPREEFSFLIGSCALGVPRIFRPIYGGKEIIFKNMASDDANLMIWMGDNIYYRKRDNKSGKHIRRHIWRRKSKHYNTLLTSAKRHYAIWDDHDFGPNNSDLNYKLKSSSLKTHKLFWRNAYYGNESQEGIFSSFQYENAEFFLLDDRFNRDIPGTENTLLGEHQIQWFKETLKSSEADFKFVVLGSQVINEKNVHECYNQYPKERQDILDFIEEHRISGVVFLTGDMHYSEVLQYQYKNGPKLIDITSSPMTSIIYKKATISADQKVKGCHILEHNYCKISVNDTERKSITLQFFNKSGDIIFEHNINLNELTW
ncbi:MAG: alkaline phosphatase family protein [Flavobacteriales bacterium]|nr:alkaline phosphatase family protein [Flavobacteriales bacterium]